MAPPEGLVTVVVHPVGFVGGVGGGTLAPVGTNAIVAGGLFTE